MEKTFRAYHRLQLLEKCTPKPGYGYGYNILLDYKTDNDKELVLEAKKLMATYMGNHDMRLEYNIVNVNSNNSIMVLGIDL